VGMDNKAEFTPMSTPPVEEFIEIEDLNEEFQNDQELENKLAELQMKINENLQLTSSNNNNNNNVGAANPNSNAPKNQFDDRKMAKIAKEEAEYARYKELSLDRDFSSVERLNIIKIVGKSKKTSQNPLYRCKRIVVIISYIALFVYLNNHEEELIMMRSNNED
jgi:chorismate mutase